MPPRTVSQLVQALTDNERRELSERIQRSLSLVKKDQAPIYHGTINADYRAQMVSQGLHDLTLVQRLKLWIRKVLSGRSNEELFVELKLADMGRELGNANLADTASKTVMPRFAEMCLKLYRRVLVLKPFFVFLWGSDDNMREAIQGLLQAKIPNAKNGLNDFLTQDEMEQLFEESETKAALRQELLNRLNSYLDNIAPDVFANIEEGLLPLYYFKELCFYNFPGLLSFFLGGGKLLKEIPNPDFRSSSIEKVLDELEHLYFAMHTATKGGDGDRLHAEIYEHYQDKQKELEKKKLTESIGAPQNFFDPVDREISPPQQETLEALDEEFDLANATSEQDLITKVVKNEKEDLIKNFRRMIRDTVKDVSLVLENGKLADLIRFFRNDPYYKFLAYVPSLNLRDFYYASTRMHVLEELDQSYSSLRELVIKRLIRGVFKFGFKEFENYRRFPMGINRSSLPPFRYVDSLCILHNYLGSIFAAYVRDLMRILMKALPSRSKDNQGEFTFHINGLENIFESLKILENSFAIENAEGKNLSRLRSNMEKDIGQERMYRIYVIQKDKELRPLLEEGLEHLRALIDLLEDVLKMPVDVINERFQAASGMTIAGGYFQRFKDIQKEMKMAAKAVRYQKLLEEEKV